MLRIRSALISLCVVLMALPAVAGPTSHAMELTNEGKLLFVDLTQGRLLELAGDQLSVRSSLEGVAEGDPRQNLVLTVTGELYLGEKKSVWMIGEDGSIDKAKPPSRLKPLFVGRPGDLAPDNSVYFARDFRNIQRSLPGGDTLPVLLSDNISKIHSLSVTPYGRVFFGNSTEIAKLNAEGEVEILVELQGDDVLGLAAEGENSVLVYRRDKAGQYSIERVDIFGTVAPILTHDQITAASSDGPVTIETPH